MSTHEFDESKVRREKGRFAEKPHSEADVDLNPPAPVTPVAEKPLSASFSVASRAATNLADAQFSYEFGENMAYAASKAPEGMVGFRRAPYDCAPDGVDCIQVGSGDGDPMWLWGVDADGNDVSLTYQDDQAADCSISRTFNQDDGSDQYQLVSMMGRESTQDPSFEGLEYRFEDYVGNVARREREKALTTTIDQHALAMQRQSAALKAKNALDDYAADFEDVSTIEFGRNRFVGVIRHDSEEIEEYPDFDYAKALDMPSYPYGRHEDSVQVDIDRLRSWRYGEDTDKVFQ